MEFNALTANPVFYRTYSRTIHDSNGTKLRKESWAEVIDRVVNGLNHLGNFNSDDLLSIKEHALCLKTLPSGRWLWIGGTDWILEPENFYGAYNCNSTNIDSLEKFGYLMDLAMQGCGTGAKLERKYISKLPSVKNKLTINIKDEPGDIPKDRRIDQTILITSDCNSSATKVDLIVGDSRQAWVDAYQWIIYLAFEFDPEISKNIEVNIYLGNVRSTGERLEKFGGVANPIKLGSMFSKVANILNQAVGRKLNAKECCLLIDEAAITVVSGNIRRSAGVRQFDSDEELLKMNLWIQDENKKWKIDPERDALRMANHTRVYHSKPSLMQCIEAVRSQYYSGEGAVMWAGEAVSRCNTDLFRTRQDRLDFIEAYHQGYAVEWITNNVSTQFSLEELQHRLSRYGINPCGEILGDNFFCNLAEVHLNQLDPHNIDEQIEAFRIAALNVCAMLHHEFVHDIYKKSREWDPIVGVSFTGLFDFFVNAFGVEWLNWWDQGRPETSVGIEFKQKEKYYLETWKTIVYSTVQDYCIQNNLKVPTRYTTVQPAGTKSLLTGASPGWHPPKSARFIRRITFSVKDPVALACLDYGYKVIPSQSDKDENGNLLEDPFDPRCQEWLVEIPVEVSWANLDGADRIDISKFSALAQMDFYMQVQKHYVTHNTSATIEIRENEIDSLGEYIYDAIQNDQGYVSVAILARFEDNQTFPRLPFEPISKEQYQNELKGVLERRVTDNFKASLDNYLEYSFNVFDHSPSGCDSDKCMFPLNKPE